MKTKLVNNLSANTLQLIINQLAGLVIFYILSIGLDKNSFGQINLALALMLAIFNILSFGIDQIAVRKLASGEDPPIILSLYISHVLITGFVFYGLLFAGRLLFPFINAYDIILLIGAGKLMIYFSTPFKQSAIGMERFRLLAYLSVISNIARACCLVVLTILHSITLRNVIIVFISGDLLELAIGTLLFKQATHLPLTIKWNKSNYISLLKESLPQFGVVMITSALARFDWIFIGIVLSAVKLAEYSFAYKVFELSTLPLLAIAPLLIPWFTRLFKDGAVPDTNKLKLLARMEMIVAAFTIVLINSCWSPVIDRLTAGKYGAVNERTIFILTLCIPLIYLTNFLWTISFAKGRLKMIFTAFAITLAVNVIADIILIPIFKNEGAAIGYLAGYSAQTIYFLIRNDVKELNQVVYPLLISTACACLSVFGAKVLFVNVWVEVGAAVLLYVVGLVVMGQVGLVDAKALSGMVNMSEPELKN
ncbi:lipopolysaccharide biosynthesis protein [Mucilaginibacter sp. McL0603]|uniref:lipopolysaccharide biosynthesis protein n=1 Tax=Mucilaginibacter sp. McL0603 TaxID=3415670 RepID=UPI003CEDA03B